MLRQLEAAEAAVAVIAAAHLLDVAEKAAGVEMEVVTLRADPAIGIVRGAASWYLLPRTSASSAASPREAVEEAVVVDMAATVKGAGTATAETTATMNAKTTVATTGTTAAATAATTAAAIATMTVDTIADTTAAVTAATVATARGGAVTAGALAATAAEGNQPWSAAAGARVRVYWSWQAL